MSLLVPFVSWQLLCSQGQLHQWKQPVQEFQILTILHSTISSSVLILFNIAWPTSCSVI